MAGHDDKKEVDWIEKVKSEGPLPFQELENCRNGWTTPAAEKFMVRGPAYLKDKVKIPADKYLLKPLGFDWMKGPSKISEVLKNPNHRVTKAVDQAVAMGYKPFVWAFNLQLPSKDNYSAIAYFVSLNPVEDGSLVDQFLKGDDTFRNSRLKLIANVVKGPWIVRTAVGEQAICILGRAVSCKYVMGVNYIEVDVDIGVSVVANAIVHLAFGYIKTLTVDIAFLIEGQTESELPERILGAARFSELDPDSAGMYVPTYEESSLNTQSSLPTRLWKSLGHSLSLLRSQGNLDATTSLSPRIKGSDKSEDKDEDTSK